MDTPHYIVHHHHLWYSSKRYPTNFCEAHREDLQMGIQWNLHIMDTLGLLISVLHIKVS